MMTSVLIGFVCQTVNCGYKEEIGIGVSTGIVIQGTFTLICPRCGHIVVIKDVVACVPVLYQQHRKP